MVAKKTPASIGLSIQSRLIEVVDFSEGDYAVQQCVSTPLPPGILSEDGDRVLEPGQLGDIIGQLLKSINVGKRAIHISLPSTLLRLIEMPKLDNKELLLSLASEAEGYKSFDNTEAVISFSRLGGGAKGPGGLAAERIIFGAIRKDTLKAYQQIFKTLKCKIGSIDLAPMQILRAMAKTRVLDSLVQQIGVEAPWGTIFVDVNRVVISLWKGNELLELRETSLNVSGFNPTGDNSLLVEDLADELKRTSHNHPPAIWLCHDLPAPLATELSGKIAVPIRPCLVDPTITQQAPEMRIPTLGASLRANAPFPFDFDFIKMIGNDTDKSPTAVPSAASPKELIYGEKPPQHPLVTVGMASILLGLVAWGGLSFYNGQILAKDVADKESKKQIAQSAVDNLNQRLSKLQQWASLQDSAVNSIREAKIRNVAYVKLANDLIKRTPETVWVHTIDMGSDLNLEGKSLNHQAVIDFARSFDQAPYVSAFLIKSIKEDFVGTTKVYSYKVGGQVKLDPTLVPEQKPSDHIADAADVVGPTNAAMPQGAKH